MTQQQTSYRQIFKATSLFGGVQVFNILISIIRSKFVAVLLGPSGMGISGLLTATTGFITALTNLGLGKSAVKNVAAEAATGNENRISTVITVLRRLVWVTGIAGMCITALLSPWLSELTFGNRDYSIAFLWISVTLLFQQLSSGQMVVLQGLRKLQYLAKANITGSVIGLLFSVPVYYIWRLNGIVPVIIISSLTSMLLSWYFARKSGVKPVEITLKKTFTEGRDMIKMGLFLSLSGLMGLGASYIVRIYISNQGGVDQVGLYNAGFAIINTYVGMVFTAMGTDYYPRLSAVGHDNIKNRILINQQAEVAILILAPILSFFLIFINCIVILFYSQKFVDVNEMIHWAALGIYFKAISWSIGYLLLAKGASKIFFWSELISNIYLLLFNILGYKYFGLEGMGISFMISYILVLVQVFLITKIKYSFSFNKVFYRVSGVQFFIGFMCFIIMRTLNAPWTYLMGSALVVISLIFSFSELEKRMGIKELVRARFNSFRGK